jgi:hypothetical protein
MLDYTDHQFEKFADPKSSSRNIIFLIFCVQTKVEKRFYQELYYMFSYIRHYAILDMKFVLNFQTKILCGTHSFHIQLYFYTHFRTF